MQDTDTAAERGYTIETLDFTHDHRTTARVALTSHGEDDSHIAVSVTPGSHAAIELRGYWRDSRYAMHHEELVTLYHAIGAALDAAGIER